MMIKFQPPPDETRWILNNFRKNIMFPENYNLGLFTVRVNKYFLDKPSSITSLLVIRGFGANVENCH